LRQIRVRTLVALGVAIIAVAIVAVPQARWRLHVVLLHAFGQIPDIEMSELLSFMMPGSDQSMAFLVEKRNPYAVFRNARTSPADVETGAAIYNVRCAACHGPGGAGGPAAPALFGRRFKLGDSDWAFYRAIRLGVPNTGMQPIAGMSVTERWQVMSYLRSLDAGAASSVTRTTVRPVPYADLAATELPSNDWRTFSGSYNSQRHSRLTEVNAENVGQLALRWALQFTDQRGWIEATPLVQDGAMYVSLAPCTVLAIDATSGEIRWTYSCVSKSQVPSEVGAANNRGVAILDDKIFVATWDARLIALDAATGRVVWETTVAENNQVYFIGSAPLAYKDLIVTGVGTREIGRAFVAAFDAATGKERWRFFAIPQPGEAGNETWSGDSWRAGGAPTWLTGSYDPAADLLYWGVGNPKPDRDTRERKGENLYTDSVVALNGSSGKLAWFFQFTPGDDKDWDANQIPVLVDRQTDAGKQSLMLWANRNGFYYVLDRVSGKFQTGMPFVEQNWAKGLDVDGRPIEHRDDLGLGGTLIFPSVGGTNWWPPTYDPRRALMIVPVLEQGMIYFSSPNTPPQGSGRSFYTAIRALDAFSGRLRWEYRRPSRFVENSLGGLVSTDGGLVFGGDQGMFFALETETGRLLWSVQTGGHIGGAPMTYAVDGHQYIAVIGGDNLLVFALPQSPSDAAPATLSGLGKADPSP
jgi:alcohol dehydrogenase (cytochrome c)